MKTAVWSASLIFALALSNGKATAGNEVVEIRKVQIAGHLSGTVKDRTGAPVAGASVEEVSQDWKTIVQTTSTDSGGWFSITSQSRSKVHYIVVTAPAFHQLRVRVRLSDGSSKQLELELDVGT